MGADLRPEAPSSALATSSRLGARKRAFDIVVSALAVALLSPLIVGVALCVRLALGKPVLFRQRRPGLHGQPFVIYKFRTMTDERDSLGRLQPDAERLTAAGRFLRRSSLDELPELFNVLKGEMSLVGPRPLRMEYLGRYTAAQARRHEVRPGITGWAQVNGRNAVSWEERFERDVFYVDHRSFGLDLKILALTVLRLWTREGISAVGHATMPDFLGGPRSRAIATGSSSPGGGT